ncbi:MAG: hypothetical protein PHW63_05650 [Alphaproteobacteria bacterium]|nr:hypothetical protein [Alphaproteobacteria bacterium]
MKQEVLIGVLATELSQIDGIKMWRLDGFGQPNKEPGTWVWVVPSLDEDPEAGPDWDGDWTYFMLHKYAGLTHERYSELDCRDTRLQVTGQELEPDCGVVEGKCITIFQADKIEVLGK